MSSRIFQGKKWKCPSSKQLLLEAAPSRSGQERIPWIFLRGSPHSGSTNSGPLHTARSRISFVRASGGSFRRRVLDALGGTRVPCLLGEQFCWHPVLPDPAPPPRRAPRPDSPVICPGFGLSKLLLCVYCKVVFYSVHRSIILKNIFRQTEKSTP